MQSSSLLQFEHVSKSFSNKTVLDGVSFQIHKNEIIALLGVNGAGKTTTIKMMLGQLAPTSGSITLGGLDPKNYLARHRVGMTPQNVEFPEAIKVKEILSFVRKHYQNPYSLDKMIDTFELSEFLDQRGSKLLGGQKGRLALALAFIGNPDLIFSDEPTTGLDVGSRKLLWDFIRQEAKNGKTIFLTTHYLEEIEQVASRVLFLRNSKLELDGTVNDVKKLACTSTVKVVFDGEQEWEFTTFSHCQNANFKDGKWTLESSEPDSLIRELVTRDVSFRSLAVERDNLEAAFLNLSQSK